MNDPKTEALLKSFLLEDAAARAKGITIEALNEQVATKTAAVATMDAALAAPAVAKPVA